MKNWLVTTFHSVGPIHFGQRRSEIRDILSAEVRQFKKTPRSVRLTDAYDQFGIHLSFDENDALELVVAFDPARPELFGEILLGRPLDDVLSSMNRLGFQQRQVRDDYCFDDIGIEIYVPYDKKLEAVKIYSKEALERTIAARAKSAARAKAREAIPIPPNPFAAG
jgi:hypothetical protein